LIACVAPRRVALMRPRDHLLKPAGEAVWNEELAFPRAAYEAAGAGSQMRVTPAIGEVGAMVDWALE
jgi:hypothetical protein